MPYSYDLPRALAVLHPGKYWGPMASTGTPYSQFRRHWPGENGPVPTEAQLQAAFDSIPPEPDWDGFRLQLVVDPDWLAWANQNPGLAINIRALLTDLRREGLTPTLATEAALLLGALSQSVSPALRAKITAVATANHLPPALIALVQGGG